MVPGLIRVPKLSKTRVAAAFLWGVLLLGVSSTGRAVPNLDPGSFVPLKLGHEGESYADALPAGPTYRLVSGRLPSGLDVTSAGRFRGTPRQRGTFAAVFEATQGSRSYPVRVAMTVYAADESDLKQRTPSFKRTGPYATEVETIALSLTSTFDQERMNTLVRVVRPRGASGPRPLLLFHRGRGFDEDSYTRLHERIASWGIAVA